MSKAFKLELHFDEDLTPVKVFRLINSLPGLTNVQLAIDTPVPQRALDAHQQKLLSPPQARQRRKDANAPFETGAHSVVRILSEAGGPMSPGDIRDAQVKEGRARGSVFANVKKAEAEGWVEKTRHGLLGLTKLGKKTAQADLEKRGARGSPSAAASTAVVTPGRKPRISREASGGKTAADIILETLKAATEPMRLSVLEDAFEKVGRSRRSVHSVLSGMVKAESVKKQPISGSVSVYSI